VTIEKKNRKNRKTIKKTTAWHSKREEIELMESKQQPFCKA